MKKLKNFVNILLALLIILTPRYSRAEDSNFDTFSLVLLRDGITYSGYMLSDVEYDRYLRLDVEFNTLSEKYTLILNYKTDLEDGLNKINKHVDDSFLDIQKLAYKEVSWWDSNKTWIFFTGGLILGGVATYFIYDGASK